MRLSKILSTLFPKNKESSFIKIYIDEATKIKNLSLVITEDNEQRLIQTAARLALMNKIGVLTDTDLIEYLNHIKHILTNNKSLTYSLSLVLDEKSTSHISLLLAAETFLEKLCPEETTESQHHSKKEELKTSNEHIDRDPIYFLRESSLPVDLIDKIYENKLSTDFTNGFMNSFMPLAMKRVLEDIAIALTLNNNRFDYFDDSIDYLHDLFKAKYFEFLRIFSQNFFLVPNSMKEGPSLIYAALQPRLPEFDSHYDTSKIIKVTFKLGYGYTLEPITSDLTDPEPKKIYVAFNSEENCLDYRVLGPDSTQKKGQFPLTKFKQPVNDPTNLEELKTRLPDLLEHTHGLQHTTKQDELTYQPNVPIDSKSINGDQCIEHQASEFLVCLVGESLNLNLLRRSMNPYIADLITKEPQAFWDFIHHASCTIENKPKENEALQKAIQKLLSEKNISSSLKTFLDTYLKNEINDQEFDHQLKDNHAEELLTLFNNKDAIIEHIDFARHALLILQWNKMTLEENRNKHFNTFYRLNRALEIGVEKFCYEQITNAHKEDCAVLLKNEAFDNKKIWSEFPQKTAYVLHDNTLYYLEKENDFFEKKELSTVERDQFINTFKPKTEARQLLKGDLNNIQSFAATLPTEESSALLECATLQDAWDQFSEKTAYIIQDGNLYFARKLGKAVTNVNINFETIENFKQQFHVSKKSRSSNKDECMSIELFLTKHKTILTNEEKLHDKLKATVKTEYPDVIRQLYAMMSLSNNLFVPQKEAIPVTIYYKEKDLIAESLPPIINADNRNHQFYAANILNEEKEIKKLLPPIILEQLRNLNTTLKDSKKDGFANFFNKAYHGLLNIIPYLVLAKTNHHIKPIIASIQESVKEKTMATLSETPHAIVETSYFYQTISLLRTCVTLCDIRPSKNLAKIIHSDQHLAFYEEATLKTFGKENHVLDEEITNYLSKQSQPSQSMIKIPSNEKIPTVEKTSPPSSSSFFSASSEIKESEIKESEEGYTTLLSKPPEKDSEKKHLSV